MMKKIFYICTHTHTHAVRGAPFRPVQYCVGKLYSEDIFAIVLAWWHDWKTECSEYYETELEYTPQGHVGPPSRPYGSRKFILEHGGAEFRRYDRRKAVARRSFRLGDQRRWHIRRKHNIREPRYRRFSPIIKCYRSHGLLKSPAIYAFSSFR